MSPQICVPIAAESASRAQTLAKRAEALGADLLEIRLDFLRSTRGLRGLVEGTPLPLIATNRQEGQGGHRPQEEGQRIKTLINAAQLGFKYVDLESTTADLESHVRELRRLGATPIVSSHDFERTPTTPELEAVMRSHLERGADICKVVTTAKTLADNVSCLMATWRVSRAAGVVCFAMGERGLVSRVLSPVFGARFTYASLEEGLETAPGQPTISDLRDLYRRLGVE